MHMVKEKIHNIEKLLVEFTTPSNIFKAAKSDVVQRHTLQDRMEFYKVPGVSISVVKDFEVEWSKAYGILSAETLTPATEGTFFEAASSTKLLTATIALQLVEQGQLDLDENVNRYLKSWKIPENEFTQEHEVTLRLLLTHQAGINAPEGGFSWEEGAIPSLTQILNGEAPAKNQPTKLEFVPGSEWRYSNLGFVIIQLLLEDVLGRSFPQLAHDLVFEPLGMYSSTMSLAQDDEISAKAALPHDSEGTVHQHQLVPTAVAHGGLITTPKDFSLLLIELMKSYHGESNLILSREMINQMFSPELELDPNVLGVPLGQGLGVFLYMQGNNLLFLHPGGNFPGANCWPIAAPEIGNAAVVMTNGAKGEVLGMEILAAILSEYRWFEAT